MTDILSDNIDNWTPTDIFSCPDYVNDKTFHVSLSRYGSQHKNIDYYSNTDSETEFRKNLKVMPVDWHYRYKKVTYELNSDNFRTYEWNNIDWKNSIVLYGCSNTFGVGVAEDETLSKQLEKLTGRQVVNLGIPAGSNELIMHMAALTIENFDFPYAAIVNWTTTDRFRYFTKDHEYFLGAWNLNNEGKEFKNMKRLYLHRNLERYNEVMHTWFHSKTVKSLFKGRSKYASVTNFGAVAKYANVDGLFICDNNARDRLHPGPDVFEKMSKFLLKFL